MRRADVRFWAQCSIRWTWKAKDITGNTMGNGMVVIMVSIPEETTEHTMEKRSPQKNRNKQI